MSQLFDKLNYIDNKMEDHFGSLRTEIASLRFELKSEIEGVKNTIKDMEKSIEAAWDTIGDIQEEMKANSKVRKQLQTDLDSHKAEIVKIRNKQPQLDDYRDEIEDLKARLAEEQEKVTALETYSRRENLRIMNIPEEPDENCSDIVYDIIQNGLNINVANMHFHAVHRVGKARPTTGDGKKAIPRPVIVRFLLRGDKDKVMSAKNKLKNSEVQGCVYYKQLCKSKYFVFFSPSLYQRDLDLIIVPWILSLEISSFWRILTSNSFNMSVFSVSEKLFSSSFL